MSMSLTLKHIRWFEESGFRELLFFYHLGILKIAFPLSIIIHTRKQKGSMDVYERECVCVSVYMCVCILNVKQKKNRYECV